MKLTNRTWRALLLSSMLFVGKAIGWLTFIYCLLAGYILDGAWRDTLLQPVANLLFTHRMTALLIPVLTFFAMWAVLSFADSFPRRKS